MNNTAKHPRFIKDLPGENLLLCADECPVSETVYETFTYAGFNPEMPIYTNDGDRVRVLMIDPLHQFPIVGEVIDFHSETTWLARWSASGVYASSQPEARAKHSLKPNVAAGAIVASPGCPCDAAEVRIVLMRAAPFPNPDPNAGLGVPELIRRFQKSAEAAETVDRIVKRHFQRHGPEELLKKL